jgi:glycosyltransferase involved in cell wall biosynthesis
MFRVAFRHQRARTIFQNPDDRRCFVDAGLLRPDQTALIRGSGVDCATFHPAAEPDGEPVVLLASRLLWDKGIAEFVEAARRLRERGGSARFVLAGRPDPGNPTAVPVAQLEAWVRAGILEWWGHRRDMPDVLRRATIVVLPSFYPEGVPKVLLEAAASGRAIITTDTPGCREIVRHRVNGLLVPPRDATAVTRAIEELLGDSGLRRELGQAGRRIAVTEFAEELIVHQTLDVYRTLLGGRRPAVARGASTTRAPLGSSAHVASIAR